MWQTGDSLKREGESQERREGLEASSSLRGKEVICRWRGRDMDIDIGNFLVKNCVKYRRMRLSLYI